MRCLIGSRDGPSTIHLNLLIQGYFDHVHPVAANAFLQRGDLNRQFRLAGFSDPLIKAVCAAAYRFTDMADDRHPDGGDAPAAWAQAAISTLLSNLNMINEDRLATMLVLVNHEAVSGRYASAWMLTSMAVRLALTLRLHVDQQSSTSWVRQERRRRLMWSAFCCDRICAGGIPEYTLCSTPWVEIALPCSDHNYALGVPLESISLGEVESRARRFGPGEDSIFSRLIRLIAIRGEILK